jgi:hypothetical protein
MRDHIGPQLPQALAAMVTGAEVRPIAKGARDRVGTGTRGREQAQLNARIRGSPWLDGLRLMDVISIPTT